VNFVEGPKSRFKCKIAKEGSMVDVWGFFLRKI
jgi:hypothetical protein